MHGLCEVKIHNIVFIKELAIEETVDHTFCLVNTFTSVKFRMRKNIGTSCLKNISLLLLLFTGAQAQTDVRITACIGVSLSIIICFDT